MHRAWQDLAIRVRDTCRNPSNFLGRVKWISNTRSGVPPILLENPHHWWREKGLPQKPPEDPVRLRRFLGAWVLAKTQIEKFPV